MKVTLLLACVAFGIGCGNDSDPRRSGGRRSEGVPAGVTVMTRNIYLGSELTGIILTPSLDDLPVKAAEIWKSVQASDFPARAQLIAAEIAAAAPDLVGLQEVELFRTQTPGDFSPATPALNADTVVYDFLDLLQQALAARGSHYKVAALSVLSDNEMPCMPAAGAALFDLRMTDRDVILIREGLEFTNPQTKMLTKYIYLKIGGDPGVPVKVVRGYESIDLTLDGTPLTFANSHLEVGGPAGAFQENQASELAATLGRQSGNIVLVGDFNSPADGSGTRSYRFLNERFVDAFAALHPADPGFTCCTDIASPDLTANQRIDLVLTRGYVDAQSLQVIGNDPAVRTPSGLWASDHAGVTARLLVGGK